LTLHLGSPLTFDTVLIIMIVIFIYCSPKSAEQSHESVAETVIRNSWRPRGLLLCHAFQRRAFAVAGPKAWNQLPCRYRCIYGH